MGEASWRSGRCVGRLGCHMRGRESGHIVLQRQRRQWMPVSNVSQLTIK